jgi:small subunit ribosomal protein S13
MYVLNTNLNDNQQALIALQKIYGLGPKKAQKFLNQIGLSKTIKLKDLLKDQTNSLIRLIESEEDDLSNSLKRLRINDCKRLIDLKTFRGLRHRNNLPCRGQRTKTNAKTRRKLRVI